jgi:hypothetical protein
MFDMTKIGMRVIVFRNDVRPVEIDHPILSVHRRQGRAKEQGLCVRRRTGPIKT